LNYTKTISRFQLRLEKESALQATTSQIFQIPNTHSIIDTSAAVWRTSIHCQTAS